MREVFLMQFSQYLQENSGIVKGKDKGIPVRGREGP
jgi:hypothetical protein